MDDKKFLDRLRKSLRMYGYDVPMEEDEIQNFDKELGKTDFPEMPENLKDPLEIIKRGLIEDVNFKGEIPEDAKTAQRLAMAAREGKGISDKVAKQMEEDRKNAEKNDLK